MVTNKHLFYPVEKWPHCHPMKSGPCEVMEPPDRAIDALWGTMRPAANNAGIRRGPWTIHSYVHLLEDHEKYTVFLSPYSFPYQLVIGIYMVPSSVSPPPPHGLGPQVVAPIPFYLQAIGSISEVQLRIC